MLNLFLFIFLCDILNEQCLLILVRIYLFHEIIFAACTHRNKKKIIKLDLYAIHITYYEPFRLLERMVESKTVDLIMCLFNFLYIFIYKFEKKYI